MDFQSKTLLIESVDACGQKNTTIKVPLGLLGLVSKALRLLPKAVQESIEQQLGEHGFDQSFESFVDESTEIVQQTLNGIEVDMVHEKQKFKLSVV